ncbi:Pyridoxal phosphate homeostasis protein [Candida parapsilosis]|uniref:Pyridoxal phosphate homeostasis protein n=2 Tax=Candida parapsilosis TaxID=5480 RepID=G8BD76_CANPC|nr:uncharacterized protein CPAR2_208660 [Candida parapsilosis]KAF6054628.1 Pyridoxal phosphate homeostasis protein [Candida parapsilosis]KAF6056346.1 Pyridoxal phosphate homeostasis protein [Candida parapsilosis]KAF6059280.1 Pyridoxal phosphate homeostasis protein [Candida parapsilosis]KAF6068036.1 Pyridoxal phosphate homeostasis protein [Candida parapsilosis]KAI5904071.1 Pyridoxal phosphate homeostasis protein [Candida parapsilosis]
MKLPTRSHTILNNTRVFFRYMSSSFPKPTKSRATELESNYNTILAKVHALNPNTKLVAVSKFKPSSDIMALYSIGVRHFGENYVQELVAKSEELPKDICWHFIGGLQSGKCKDLSNKVSNLWAVETVDSLKKCRQLNNARERKEGDVINVYLQVNTSGEEQKSGFLQMSDLEETIEYIQSDECKKLKLVGLMTIGSISESKSDHEENYDFKKLVEWKHKLDEKYNLDLELSMGMSSDFEQAIKQGSSSVRVGSSIFGARPPKVEN